MASLALVLVMALAIALAVLVWARPESFEPSGDTGGAGDAAAGSAVVRGSRADLRRFPWFCSFMKNGRRHYGGSLIRSNIVLTAAHAKPRKGDTVVIGGTEKRTVAKVVIPRLELGKDIALAKLKTPSRHTPVRLAWALPGPNAPVTVLGFGRTMSGNPSDTLQRAQLRYMSIAERHKTKGVWLEYMPRGADAFLKPQHQTKVVFAKSAQGKAACVGDSGGPLIIERGPGMDLLLGVVNEGPVDCNIPFRQLSLSAFASVPFWEKWISANATQLQRSAT